MTCRDDAIAILHVDDEPGFRDLTVDALEAEDDRFAVETAPTASEGLDLLGDGGLAIDCVVSDYDMPVMDGIDFLREVRADHPELPFILFTGKGSETVAAEAIEHGVSSYLRKEGNTTQYSLLANRIRTHVEQYRTTQRAQRIEQEYRLTAEVAADMFYTYDRRSGELRLQTGFKRFGYDPDALDADIEWWFDRVHPADRERMSTLQEAATTPGPEGFERYTGDRGWFENEFRWQRADGSYAHVVGSGVTIFDGGQAIKQVGTMRDVTDQREREEELALFKELIDESSALVFIAEAATGQYAFVNQTACAELGYARADLLDRHVYDIETAFKDRADWDAHVATLREEGEAHVDGEFRRSDGSTIPVELTLSYVPLGTEYVVAIARDISERLEREQALERQNTRLEQFASMVSHDLRNPLQIADSYLELAREDPTEEHFDGIETALTRIDRLIEDVLYLTRDCATTAPTAGIDLDAVAAAAWELVPETSEATLVVDEACPAITADEDQLAQLLENLFSNAIEHGGPTVTIRVEPVEGGFAVEDTGPGIPAEDRERVFEDGYSTSPEGTGLGLTIVQEIADCHGWEITLAPGEGGGARFEITGVTGAEPD